MEKQLIFAFPSSSFNLFGVNVGHKLQNPTATYNSYWDLGSQDTPLFARLVMLVIPFLTPYLTTLVNIARYTTLSIQISILGDLFMLLTIHIHCFYAYARRLALSQYQGIVTLWRLFIGKKYNPLRNRVDSADCTVEQLFLGTIIFTILLFLFPTTLTFFFVFFTLKCVAKLIMWISKNIKLLLHWLPNNDS